MHWTAQASLKPRGRGEPQSRGKPLDLGWRDERGGCAALGSGALVSCEVPPATHPV